MVGYFSNDEGHGPVIRIDVHGVIYEGTMKKGQFDGPVRVTDVKGVTQELPSLSF